MKKKLLLLVIITIVLGTAISGYFHASKIKNKSLVEKEILFVDKDIDDEEDNEQINDYQLLNLVVGQTYHLQYDFLANTLSNVNFISQDTSIASVDKEGNATALSQGSTTVTLYYTGGSNGTDGKTVVINLAKANLNVE